MRLACIPAYNEEASIAGIVESASRHVDRVVVCDDGSTDGTARLASRAGATVISHKRNRGYGASIISLFDYARSHNADVVVTIDSDGQHDPGQIPALVDALVQHNVDVVIGSRFLAPPAGGGEPGAGDHSGVPRYRRLGIKIITSAANLGTDLKVSDSQSGFRVYSRNAINAIHPTEEGMSVSTEILLKISNKGLSLAEVPISVSYGGDSSSHNPAYHGVSVLANTIKYTSVRHPLPFFGIPGVAFVVAGMVSAGMFMDQYLNNQTIFFGSLLASVILILIGTILSVASVILFSMATLIRDRR